MTQTILIVDDNEMNLKLLEAMLRTRGYALRKARSGDEALTAIAASHPDLVLLDIQMPGLSGIEVVRLLRTVPDTALLPVIAVTAMAMKGDRETILAAGFSDYLAKPYRMTEVAQIVARWLPSPGADTP